MKIQCTKWVHLHFGLVSIERADRFDLHFCLWQTVWGGRIRFSAEKPRRLGIVLLRGRIRFAFFLALFESCSPTHKRHTKWCASCVLKYYVLSYGIDKFVATNCKLQYQRIVARFNLLRTVNQPLNASRLQGVNACYICIGKSRR